GMGVNIAGMVIHSYQNSQKKAIPQKEMTYKTKKKKSVSVGALFVYKTESQYKMKKLTCSASKRLRNESTPY
ncbi:hypothetical protein FO516_29935, partial [Priestia megaterium]